MFSLVIYAIVSASLALVLQSTLRFGDQNAGKRPLKGSGHWVDRADQWYEGETRRSLSGGTRKGGGYLLGWIVFAPLAYSETWWYGLVFGAVGGVALAYAVYNFKK